MRYSETSMRSKGQVDAFLKGKPADGWRIRRCTMGEGTPDARTWTTYLLGGVPVMMTDSARPCEVFALTPDPAGQYHFAN